MVPPLASHSGCLLLPSWRVQHDSGKRRPVLPTFGHVFNRKAVESALRRARALWGRLPQSEYPNGAVIFCSDSIAEVARPLRPLQRR
eukprot:8673278-Karenia_brevis.AAC.1